MEGKSVTYTSCASPYILEHEFRSDHVYGHADDEMNKWADAIGL